MKQIYLLLIALAFSLSALAQTNFKPGYILTADSIKVEGLIDDRGVVRAAQRVAFKTSGTAEAVEYQPSQILGYGLNGGRQYESLSIKAANNTSQTYFLEVLAKGSATLYFMKSEDLKERYFITTNDGRLHELIQEIRRVDNGSGKVYNATLKHYVGTLTSLMEACPDVKQSINKARFEQPDLISVVNKYNVCIAPDEVKVSRDADESKTKFEKFIIVGGTLTQAILKSESYVDRYVKQGNPDPSLDIIAGLTVNITANKLSRNLSFYTGLMYYHYRIEGVYMKDYSGEAYNKIDYFLEAAHLKMPLLIRYTWPKGKVKPFLNAGAQVGALLKSDSKVVDFYKKNYGDETKREYAMMPSYRKGELGFVGGLGVKMEVFGKTIITLEARQERNNGLSSGIGLSHNNNISSVLLGVSF